LNKEKEEEGGGVVGGEGRRGWKDLFCTYNEKMYTYLYTLI